MKLKKTLSALFLSAIAVPVFSLSVNAAAPKDKTLNNTTLTSDMTVTGNLTVTGSLNLNGFKLTVNKNLYGSGNINVQGGTLNVKGDLYESKNVSVENGKLLVGGSYFQTSSTLDLNNGRVEVGGDFRLQDVSKQEDGTNQYNSCYATLKMNDEADYLLVKGDCYIQSNWGDGSTNNDLTNGTLELKGNFAQINGSGRNFNAKENHKVIFSGENLQTVTFQDAGSSGFNILAGTVNPQVDITAGRINKIGAETTLENFVQYGNLDVNGKNFSINGNMIQHGNVSVNKGLFKVFGDYSQREGCLDLDNGTLRVTGDYRLQSVREADGKTVYDNCYGVLKMNDLKDYFVIGGDCYIQSNWGDGSTNNDLTNGKLVLKGDFYQINGSSLNFNAKGNHRVLFFGSKKQTIHFDSPGNSGFNILDNSTNKNVVLTAARINKIGVNATVYSFEQYGSLDLNGKTFAVTNYFKEYGNVNINKGTFRIGSYYMHQDGCLDLNNGRVEVTGNYRLQSSSVVNKKTVYSSGNATLKMNDPDDYFLVKGSFFMQSNWGDGSTNNDLIDGTLELKGNFYQYNGSGVNFNAKGNHKVLFSGDKLQTISFSSPGDSGFNVLSATENTRVDIKAGRINRIGGAVVQIAGFTQYGSLDLDGNSLSLTKNLIQNGNISLSGGELNIGGNYIQQDGILDLNNGKITVNGDYRLQNTAQDKDGKPVYNSCYGVLKMNDAEDYFLVKGNMYVQSNWGDGSTNNDLTNGTLELKGNFFQYNGSGSNFNARGSHKVIFSGDTRQQIHFDSPGNSGFNLLYATPNTDVDITAARINKAGSNVTILNFTQYGTLDLDGNTLTITNDLKEYGNINVHSGKLVVRGNAYHCDGALDLNQGTVEVDGDYRLQQISKNDAGEPEYNSCYGVLKMNDAGDYFLVKGNMYVQSNWGDGSTNNDLVNGTLELKGNFSQINGSSNNFNAKGSHQVIFSGSTLQTVTFASPGSSGFNILAKTTNKNVDLTAARIYVIGTTGTAVKNFTQYGSLDLNGKSFTVTGNFSQFGSVNLNKGQFNVNGYYYHQDGSLDLNNGKLTVGKNYRLQSLNKNSSGTTVYGSCYGVLKMNDPNDYFLVKGNMCVQSNWGDGLTNNDLTNGTLELRGNFFQYNGSGYCFNAKGNHKVVFSGTTTQTVRFDSPDSSGFNILYSTPNKKVAITAGRINQLGSNTGISSFVQYGTLNLNHYTLSVSGSMTQNGSVFGNKGTLDVAKNYTQHNGILDLNNGTVKVGGNYRLQSESVSDGKTVYGSAYGVLKMNDKDDYFIVNGDFFTQSNWGDGSTNNDLTDGMLEIHGSFYQLNGNSRCFSAVNNHKTHFVGEKTHEVTFASKSSFFRYLLVDGKIINLYFHGPDLSYYFAADDDHILNLSRLDYDSVVLGEEAALTLSAFGGKPAPAGYLYSISYKKVADTEYTPLRDYSTDTTFTFTPPALGKYDVSVTVIDSEFKTSTQEMVLEVVEPLVNTSTVSASKLTLGETLVVTGAAENGVGAYEYALYSKKSGQTKFTLVSSFSNNAIINYTPSLPGTYTVRVVVRDMKGHTANLEYPLTVDNNLENVSSISASVIRYGESVTATAKADHGVAPYQYAFYYRSSKTTKWTTLQDYGNADSASVSPTVPGNYVFRVNVKDATGKIVRKDLEFTVENPPALQNTSTVSASEIMLGENVCVTFGAKDGVSPYQFAVYYRPLSKTTWTKVTDYTTDSSVLITPKSPVDYIIRVNAKDSIGNIIRQEFPLHVKDLVPTNTSTLSADTVSEGESIIVNCSAEGGTAPYQYSVWYMNKATSKWTKVRDYADGDKVTVNLAAGTYVIRVNVKDAAGKIVKNDYDVTVLPTALANTSTISATSIQKGQSLTVTASAKGGEKPYLYGVWYKKTSASSWTKARDYAAGQTITITPKYAAEYTVRVNVKDASGEIDKKDFIVNIK